MGGETVALIQYEREKKRPNARIIHTQITPDIRVSTAAIYYPYGSIMLNPSPYYQYETWCFSDDNRQRSFQVIHGCWYKVDYLWLVNTIKIHMHIVKNLKARYEVK